VIAHIILDLGSRNPLISLKIDKPGFNLTDYGYDARDAVSPLEQRATFGGLCSR
jgi:hypothetical protein